MKIKDLFGVLLTSQDVSLYNACGIINNMYSSPTIARGSFIVINFKKNYTRG